MISLCLKASSHRTPVLIVACALLAASMHMLSAQDAPPGVDAALFPKDDPAAVPLPALPPSPTWKHEELKRFPVAEANQGVAVGANYFYAIDNKRIGKYRKDTGERVAGWEAPKGSPIKHLNAGFVSNGRLYVAHSNYPAQPELSTIEVWDLHSLKHIARQPFVHSPGSLTWLAWRNNAWHACFAHYEKEGGPGPAATRIIRYDERWQRTRTWKFPDEVITSFGKYSASCGAFGLGEHLFVTGHDRQEIYVMNFPAKGSTLELVATVPISAEGQGFAFDPTDPTLLYSISRKKREVIVSRLLVE